MKLTNVGRSVLDSTTLFVTGNSHFVGQLLINETVSQKVYPSSDSHLEIEFSSQEKGKKRLVIGSYFEPGYSGSINVTITDDSVISVIDTLNISKY